MKPVTELMKEARRRHGYMWPRLREAFQCFETGEDGGYEPNWALLEVLDLVATLPPERLGLVRWAAGLDTADALAVLDALVDAHGRENSSAVARLRDGLMTALSGGEGGAKVAPKPTIFPAGKPPPFLRVGMVLKEPTANRLWTIQEVWQVGSARCTCPDAIGGWWACDVLRTWPLAEPFAVGGES